MRKLHKFIKQQFPKRKIIYRNEEFLFLADLPVKYMEEYTNSELKGIERVKYLIQIFSYKPKMSKRTLDNMPATMLMELYQILFPKKVETTSPNPTLISTSLPKSSTSPVVKSAIGDTMKSEP